MVLVAGIGTLVSLIFLAYLTFSRVPTIIGAPIAVVVLCLFAGLPILDTVLNVYMPGAAGFFSSYFLIFMLGAILGNVYQVSGAASSIGEYIGKKFGAKYVMAACLIGAAILSYGGINSFVIIFVMYPIALALFEQANLPQKFIPGIVCGGMWTFAMTGPGTPQISNIIPMTNLGTTSMAGAKIGIPTAIIQAILIVLYMNRQAKKSTLKGAHFEWPSHINRTDSSTKRPSFIISLIPIIIVMVLFNAAKLHIVTALVIGNLIALALFYRFISKEKLKSSIYKGATSAIAIIINTSMVVGIGSVSRQTAFFQWAVDLTMNSQANPYIIAFIASNAFAGILGSSSGGLGLTYEALKDTFLMFGQQGYNLGFIHRLSSIGSGGLDSLPYNGSIVSILGVCNLTHKEAYWNIWVTCGIIPVATGIFISLPLTLLFG